MLWWDACLPQWISLLFPKPCIDNTITTQRIIGELNADNLNRYKTNPISQELTVARCTNPGDEREESIYNTDNIIRYCEASEFNRQNDGWFWLVIERSSLL